MPTDKEQSESSDHEDVTPPDGNNVADIACPNCGSIMSTGTFRTGSVEHQAKPMSVCPSCGSRR